MAQAIPTYMMNVFSIPNGLLDEMSSLMANIWWGSKDKEKGMHWKSWKSFCLQKNLGGPGFCDLRVFNQALLEKQGWHLIPEPSSPLARVLKARYYPNSIFTLSFRGSNPSFTWRSIWGAKSLLLDGLIWRIGKVTNVSIWRDAWIPGCEGLPSPTMEEEECLNLRVCDLMCPGGGEWDVGLVDSLFT